jgi:hypothetical protein
VVEMNLVCKSFGHDPSNGRLRRDPATFTELTVCRRCRIELTRKAGKWSENRDDADLIACAVTKA